MKIIVLLLSSILAQHSFTVSFDNESLIQPDLFTNDSFVGTYNSFKKDCYKGSEKINKINIGIFPSAQLVSLYKKGLPVHINSIFKEVNKITIGQVNIQLVPILYKVPKFTSINVLGDLSAMVRTLMRTKDKQASYNLFLHNGYSGIVGASYIGVIYNKSGLNVGVSRDNYVVVAHEILHGFGCQHTFSTGGIMSYQNQLINGLFQMSEENRPQICGFLKFIYK